MTLNELYKKRLNTSITEAYGISDKLHGDIIPRFIRGLKAAIKKTDVNPDYAVPTKEGKFEFKCLDEKGNTFRVYWKVYYFDSQEEYLNFYKKYGLTNNVIYKFKMLTISVVYVEGKPLNNQFYDSIGHELEHLYQNELMGNEFGNQDVYRLAISGMHEKDEYIRCLSIIIYASTKSEQEGFINGFYSEFSHGNINPNNLDKEIEESDCGYWLKNLYVAYRFLKQHNDEKMQNCISVYKTQKDYYNYKYFLYVARNGIKNLERRIARLTYKIKQDMFTHSRPQLNENFDLLNNYYLIQ